MIVGIVVIFIAMNLAELGTLYPVAGGMYSLVRYVLPGPISWITMFNYIVQGIIIPSSIALGIAQFLKLLLPSLPISNLVIATIALAIGTVIALVRVELGAWVTMVMVVVELLVLSIITGSAILHPHQSLWSMVAQPKMLVGHGLKSVTVGIMLATLAPAFNVINGYDASLGFVEEIIGGRKKIAHSVIIAAVLSVVFILIPLVMAMVAAPNLVTFFENTSPVVYSVSQSLGPSAGKLVDFGVIIALFNAMLSLLMYFARVAYTTARDECWWPGANRTLSSINRFKVPGWSVLLLALPAFVLMFFAALNWLIIFSGTVIAVVYFFVGIAAFLSRIRDPRVFRPYRMPLWPVPSLVVIAVTGFAIVTQESQFLLGEGILALLAIGAWAIFKPRNLGRAAGVGVNQVTLDE